MHELHVREQASPTFYRHCPQSQTFRHQNLQELNEIGGASWRRLEPSGRAEQDVSRQSVQLAD